MEFSISSPPPEGIAEWTESEWSRLSCGNAAKTGARRINGTFAITNVQTIGRHYSNIYKKNVVVVFCFCFKMGFSFSLS